MAKGGFKKFRKDIVVLFRALIDRRTPWWIKIIGLAAVAYIILPFDIIPDYIPVLGWLDDITFAGICVWVIAKLIPREIMDYYKDLENGGKK
jgi:uncharacterized membrane protein YkvA (DUF1232 family)